MTGGGASGDWGLNPLAFVLLAASLAPLAVSWLRRRRSRPGTDQSWGWPAAWALLGLAACGLLAPALTVPDGVPSPAATLGDVAPWAGELDPAAGNPASSDVTHQIQPWLLFLRAELRAGRLPWWNPFQYSGTPYWSNGQGAPLFPLHLLFAALPERLGWLLLPWLRVVIGGLGVRALALRLGLGRRPALGAGLIYPLSGMLTSFLLYPMGNALMLVPWVLWAVEGIAAERRTAWRAGVLPLAVVAGLQLLAGHPETVVHTGLLAALYLLVRGAAVAGWPGRILAWARFAAGWALAAGLAAVQVVPLVATVRASSRWQRQLSEFTEPLGRLLTQPLRLLFPDLYGHPVDATWWGPYNYLATAVYVGAFALPLAAAGLARLRVGDESAADAPGRRFDRRWLGVVAILVLSFAGAYHLPPVRQLLAALPVVGRALHHRLIFGVELALALLAAGGLELWLRGRHGRRSAGRGALWASAAVAAGLAALAWWRFAEPWVEQGLIVRQLLATVSVLGAVALLAGLWSLRDRSAIRWAAVGLIWVIPLELIVVHARFNPGLSQADLYPATPAVTLLQKRLEDAGPGRVAATASHLAPNAAMAYRLLDIRGDDTVKLADYERFAASTFDSGHPTFFRPIGRWNAAALDRLGVHWVLGGPREDAPLPGWRVIYDGRDARVWERPGRPPMVRWSAPAGSGWAVDIVDRAPGRWLLHWTAPAEGTLVVAEAFDSGWRARARSADSETVAPPPVERVEEALIGVALGPGEGEVELVYRPSGLGWGAGLSALALAIVAFLAWSSRGRSAAESAETAA